MNLPTRIKHAFAGILGLLALLTAHAGPSARKLRFDHLSVTDGLSQMSVVSVVQDADGYLWFGTRDGLNRYDGYDFRIFRHELHDTTSISDSYIRCMANDRDGRLWVGTTNGLNRYDPRTERFARYYIDRERHTGNINEINAICADPAGGVWLGTYEGLYHLGRTRRRRAASRRSPNAFTVWQATESNSTSVTTAGWRSFRPTERCATSSATTAAVRSTSSILIRRGASISASQTPGPSGC